MGASSSIQERIKDCEFYARGYCSKPSEGTQSSHIGNICYVTAGMNINGEMCLERNKKK